jgi:hypothetical protein
VLIAGGGVAGEVADRGLVTGAVQVSDGAW